MLAYKVQGSKEVGYAGQPRHVRAEQLAIPAPENVRGAFICM